LKNKQLITPPHLK